ncbi:MAG TPA: hypothetical protein VFD45_03315 [Patescibacteria group bacterium]|nr:hypothetical protein [Patescibacteria group bacterium]
MILRKKIFSILLAIILLLLSYKNILAQDSDLTLTPSPTPVDDQKIEELQNKIDDLQKKVSDLQGQAKTLSSQISVMDNQIKLTEYRIESTREQLLSLAVDIDTADKKIDTLEKGLDQLSKVLLKRIVTTYEVGTAPSFQILLASNNVSNFFTRLNYLKLAQAHDRKLIYDTQQAKTDYSNQKDIFENEKIKVESLKKQLEDYTIQLDREKQGKQRLLEDTKGSEVNYQRLLAQARAEYEAIQGIVSGLGQEVESGPVGEGQAIANVISAPSCNSGGAHLHFIVTQNGSNQNPFNYLSSIASENCSGSSCGSSDGDAFNPSGSWSWPLDGPIRLTQGYGSTWATKNTWVRNIYSFHNGIDILGPSFTVKAVKSGTLYRGSYSVGCSLRYIKVVHADGFVTFYLHVNY